MPSAQDMSMDLATLRHHAPSSSDAQRVLRSLARVQGSLELVACDFFAALERSSPNWASALPAEGSTRRACFALCLGWVRAHVENATVLGSLVYRVGASPAGTISSRLNLGFLASALLESLASVDPEWDEATRMAWLRTCAWAAWCVRHGHEARLAGKIASRDALELSPAMARRTASLRDATPTLVSAGHAA
jgi:hypothetical protein